MVSSEVLYFQHTDIIKIKRHLLILAFDVNALNSYLIHDVLVLRTKIKVVV